MSIALTRITAARSQRLAPRMTGNARPDTKNRTQRTAARCLMASSYARRQING